MSSSAANRHDATSEEPTSPPVVKIEVLISVDHRQLKRKRERSDSIGYHRYHGVRASRHRRYSYGKERNRLAIKASRSSETASQGSDPESGRQPRRKSRWDIKPVDIPSTSHICRNERKPSKVTLTALSVGSAPTAPLAGAAPMSPATLAGPGQQPAQRTGSTGSTKEDVLDFTSDEIWAAILEDELAARK